MQYGNTLAIDGAGDLMLDARHRLETVDGGEKVGQDIRVLLQSAKGSLPFNLGWGTDLQAMTSPKTIATAVRTALNQYPHLQEILAVAVTQEDRTATVQVRLRTRANDQVFAEVAL